MQIIHIDISKKSILPTIYAKQGDVGRKFKAVITDNGIAYDVSNKNFSAGYNGASGSGNYKTIGEKSAFEINENTVIAELVQNMFIVPGKTLFCLTMKNDEGSVISFWNIPVFIEETPGFLAGPIEDYYPDPESHEKYFVVDVDGLVSLKPEYNADGANNSELPEVLVIPDVINDIAVTALSEKMFNKNHRVRSVTIPHAVTTIPKTFANKAVNLEEVKGTENIEVIGQIAFQQCGIKKAIFPKLKSFEGQGQFIQAANLSIADIGNSVTAISPRCFAGCERLSLVRGGASVADIGEIAFNYTRSLKNLPLVANVKSIGNQAFLCSRVNFDWWEFERNSGCTFGTTDPTPAHYNASDWWSDCTSVPCENPLGSTFHQKNPEWANCQIPNSSSTYGTGCTEISTAHIYSALTGVTFDTPRYFVENIVGGIDNGSLLVPTGKDKDGNPVYRFEDMANWLTALDLQCELLFYNNDTLKNVYAALAAGGMILTFVHPSHTSVIYGVAENGEMLILDSDGYNYTLQDYTARTFQQPIWSFVKSGLQLLIVKKKEE